MEIRGAEGVREAEVLSLTSENLNHEGRRGKVEVEKQTIG
jgi:hypothetical protein